MIKSLWIRFLILLFAVSLIALSAAFVLREMMISDFRQFLEGEQEDRVYWVTATIEGSYEKYGRWRIDTVQSDTLLALMLGFETRLLDRDGAVVMDMERALDPLSPLVKQRIQELSAFRFERASGPFHPYPLFLGEREIGRLEVRFLAPKREAIFLRRSNTFLLSALGILGGLAVITSIIFSSKLTRPLTKIASVATAISDGDLTKRVDVTGRDELGRLSRAFNRMANTLETQESLRKKLISNVAHELRTPLTAIQGEIEGMMDGLIATDREQLLSLYEEAGRLKKMLNGMEDLAQAQASALTLKKRTIELKPFLENILERMRRLVADKGIVIIGEYTEGLTINADPDGLSQVVINLVSNAVKAVERGGAVTVAARPEGSDILIEVRDTGIGIKADDLPFIFERFYKASPGGLGLGLAIARELVVAHGGSLDVRSAVGAGSVFSVHLPA